jgi:hypothetical protein
MQTVSQGEFAANLARYLAQASKAPLSVFRRPHVEDALPHRISVEFIAMPFVDLERVLAEKARPPKFELTPIELPELKHELSCGYIGYHAERRTIYKTSLPRMPSVALLSEKMFAALHGSSTTDA